MDKQQQNVNRVNYGANRKQSYIIPKRGYLQRYPLIYISVCTVIGLGTFFSRPIYDAFIRDEYTEYVPPEQRRQAIQNAWRA